MDGSTKWECMDCPKERKKHFVKCVLCNSQKFAKATNMLVDRSFINRYNNINININYILCEIIDTCT